LVTVAEVIHDTILVPHGTPANEVMWLARAQAEAKSNLGLGESIEDLQLGTGSGTGPTSPMMKWGWWGRILRPGGSVAARPR
jgi:hypothetical protein